MKFKKTIVKFRINTLEKSYIPSLKQITLMFWDQMCPKKRFWEWNLRKPLSFSDSTPLKTYTYRVSFKTGQFEVSGPILPK